ncbi:MAG: hypothetical protein J6Q94_09855 [Clostridia bacterium]|nr:hypothetical protein [Clostridia bacterium]
METKEFDEILNFFPERIKSVLKSVSTDVKSNTYEIRLRSDKPIVLFANNGSNFIKTDSTVSAIDSKYSFCISKDELQQVISGICGYSLYSHQNDIANGFVTFGNGHRAGFCGTAILNDGRITALRDIESVNIRISRYIENSAKELIEEISKQPVFNGIIIAGAPCTGKTTVLKGFASEISSLYRFGYMKTVLIDERFEMGCVRGLNCDVLCGFPKTEGIMHAIRVLSPEIIVCDEVVSMCDAESIIKGCYSGVKFVVSIHVGAYKDIFLRPISKKLTDSGFFDYVVFLDNALNPGRIKKIVKTEDLKSEFYCNSCCNN